jgi:hypothetical protein
LLKELHKLYLDLNKQYKWKIDVEKA